MEVTLEHRFNGPIPSYLTMTAEAFNHHAWVWKNEKLARRQALRKAIYQVRKLRKLGWPVEDHHLEDIRFAFWNWKQAVNNLHALQNPKQELKHAAE